MLLIQQGFLHPMTGVDAFIGDLLVENGRIVRLAPSIDPTTLRPETRVLDARGLHVWPGLIDTHTHLGRIEDSLQPDTQDPAFQQAAEAGVTTVCLCPGPEAAAPQTCEVWQTGPAPLPIAAPGLVKAAFDGAEEEALRRLCEECAAKGLKLKAQVHSEQAIRLALAFHEQTHADLVLEHCTDGAALAQQIADSGLAVLLGASCRRGHGSCYALAARFSAWGIPVALSTGHPFTCIHHLSLCAGLCMRAGMTEEAAMRAVTAVPASILRLDGELGTLQEGLRADLMLTDGSPLHLATAVHCTILGGRVVYKRA